MACRNEVTCDRCGAVIVDLDRSAVQLMKDASAKIHYWGVGVPRSWGEQRIDLCTRCAEKFIIFLEGSDDE